MGPKASFRRALKHDYPCFLIAIIGSFVFAVALAVALTGEFPSRRRTRKVGPAARTGFAVAAGGVALLAAGLFAARYARLRRIVAAGRLTDATLLRVTFFRDRCRLEFAYAWEGTSYVDGHAVSKTRETRALKVGGVLRVAVDPLRPARAVPVDLLSNPL